MIDELKVIFSKFAEKYNLLWSFEYIGTSDTWVLTYQNQEQSWGYRRVFENRHLTEYQGSVADLGDHVLAKVLLKMRCYKLI